MYIVKCESTIKSTWNIGDLTDLIISLINVKWILKVEVVVKAEVHPNTSHILVIHRRPESFFF